MEKTKHGKREKRWTQLRLRLDNVISTNDCSLFKCPVQAQSSGRRWKKKRHAWKTDIQNPDWNSRKITLSDWAPVWRKTYYTHVKDVLEKQKKPRRRHRVEDGGESNVQWYTDDIIHRKRNLTCCRGDILAVTCDGCFNWLNRVIVVVLQGFSNDACVSATAGVREKQKNFSLETRIVFFGEQFHESSSPVHHLGFFYRCRRFPIFRE